MDSDNPPQPSQPPPPPPPHLLVMLAVEATAAARPSLARFLARPDLATALHAHLRKRAELDGADAPDGAIALGIVLFGGPGPVSPPPALEPLSRDWRGTLALLIDHYPGWATGGGLGKSAAYDGIATALSAFPLSPADIVGFGSSGPFPKHPQQQRRLLLVLSSTPPSPSPVRCGTVFDDLTAAKLAEETHARGVEVAWWTVPPSPATLDRLKTVASLQSPTDEERFVQGANGAKLRSASASSSSSANGSAMSSPDLRVFRFVHPELGLIASGLERGAARIMPFMRTSSLFINEKVEETIDKKQFVVGYNPHAQPTPPMAAAATPKPSPSPALVSSSSPATALTSAPTPAAAVTAKREGEGGGGAIAPAARQFTPLAPPSASPPTRATIASSPAQLALTTTNPAPTSSISSPPTVQSPLSRSTLALHPTDQQPSNNNNAAVATAATTPPAFHELLKKAREEYAEPGALDKVPSHPVFVEFLRSQQPHARDTRDLEVLAKIAVQLTTRALLCYGKGIITRELLLGSSAESVAMMNQLRAQQAQRDAAAAAAAAQGGSAPAAVPTVTISAPTPAAAPPPLAAPQMQQPSAAATMIAPRPPPTPTPATIPPSSLAATAALPAPSSMQLAQQNLLLQNANNVLLTSGYTARPPDASVTGMLHSQPQQPQTSAAAPHSSPGLATLALPTPAMTSGGAAALQAPVPQPPAVISPSAPANLVMPVWQGILSWRNNNSAEKSSCVLHVIAKPVNPQQHYGLLAGAVASNQWPNQVHIEDVLNLANPTIRTQLEEQMRRQELSETDAERAMATAMNPQLQDLQRRSHGRIVTFSLPGDGRGGPENVARFQELMSMFKLKTHSAVLPFDQQHTRGLILCKAMGQLIGFVFLGGDSPLPAGSLTGDTAAAASASPAAPMHLPLQSQSLLSPPPAHAHLQGGGTAGGSQTPGMQAALPTPALHPSPLPVALQAAATAAAPSGSSQPPTFQEQVAAMSPQEAQTQLAQITSSANWAPALAAFVSSRLRGPPFDPNELKVQTYVQSIAHLATRAGPQALAAVQAALAAVQQQYQQQQQQQQAVAAAPTGAAAAVATSLDMAQRMQQEQQDARARQFQQYQLQQLQQQDAAAAAAAAGATGGAHGQFMFPNQSQPPQPHPGAAAAAPAQGVPTQFAAMTPAQQQQVMASYQAAVAAVNGGIQQSR
ncbi:hypothetical protein BC828DRAFT_436052 [Blastocladiella britannica]|nr:hypothetical protein BC828DRAFT_436052 [Blastocladiella britannica]